MAHIAIYGGAFNPPTIAHQAVIENCLQNSRIDEVWIMPSADRFDKQFDIDNSHRLAMLELLRKNIESDAAGKLTISRLEIDELPRPTETRRTYLELKNRYPLHSFHFVFGSDAYRAMVGWPGGKTLQRELPMLVVPRYSENLEHEANVTVPPPIRCENVSSSMARAHMAVSGQLGGLVCQPIIDYIEQHDLYRDYAII